MNKEQIVDSLELTREITQGLPMVIYGTFLGTCRGGEIIPWDGDVDLWILAESWQPEYYEAFKKAGFLIHRTVHWDDGRLSKFQMTYGDKKNRFCFNIFYSHEDNYVCKEGGMWPTVQIPKEYLDNLKVYILEGVRVFGPRDYEGFLTYMYGKDWRVPVRNWYFSEEHKRNRKKFINADLT